MKYDITGSMVCLLENNGLSIVLDMSIAQIKRIPIMMGVNVPKGNKNHTLKDEKMANSIAVKKKRFTSFAFGIM